MRLRVLFGLVDKKEVDWWRSLQDFPNIIKFLGRNYEWITYDADPEGKVDQILTFSPLMSYDPNYDVLCPLWTDMFGDEYDRCECGAKATSFEWDHMRFCRKWKPW